MVTTSFKRASALAYDLEGKLNRRYKRRKAAYKSILGSDYMPTHKSLYLAYPNGKAASEMATQIEWNSAMLAALEHDDVMCQFGSDKRWRCWAVAHKVDFIVSAFCPLGETGRTNRTLYEYNGSSWNEWAVLPSSGWEYYDNKLSWVGSDEIWSIILEDVGWTLHVISIKEGGEFSDLGEIVTEMKSAVGGYRPITIVPMDNREVWGIGSDNKLWVFDGSTWTSGAAFPANVAPFTSNYSIYHKSGGFYYAWAKDSNYSPAHYGLWKTDGGTWSLVVTMPDYDFFPTYGATAIRSSVWFGDRIWVWVLGEGVLKLLQWLVSGSVWTELSNSLSDAQAQLLTVAWDMPRLAAIATYPTFNATEFDRISIENPSWSSFAGAPSDKQMVSYAARGYPLTFKRIYP